MAQTHAQRMAQKLQYNRKYRAANPDKVKKWRKQSRERNPEPMRARSLGWYYENREKAIRQNRAYKKKNKERINALRRERLKDPRFKMRDSLHRLLWEFLKKSKGTRLGGQTKAAILIGCNVGALRRWLEKKFKPGMTWKNWGVNGWHVDHIIPCCAFDLTDPEQQKKCFHYKNLQPLWCHENYAKGRRIGSHISRKL